MSSLELTPHERFFFDVNGYLVRHGVLSAVEVEAINVAIEQRRFPPPGDDLMSQRMLDPLGWGEPFLELLEHPSALGVLRDLLGDAIRLDHAYGIQMAKGQVGLGIHGGATPFDPSQYYLHRDGRMYNGLVGVMWGLSPSHPGDGGFCCIPGSHKANEPVPDDVAEYAAHRDWITEVPLPPGTMLVFTEALAHGTLPWLGAAARRTLVYKYAPGHMAWAPGPGWAENVYGNKPGSGMPTAELAASVRGTRKVLMHPPCVLGFPEGSNVV